MQAGYVDPESLLFARERVEQVHEVARTRVEALSTLDAEYAAVFRRHPFHQPRDLVVALRRLIWAGLQAGDRFPLTRPRPYSLIKRWRVPRRRAAGGQRGLGRATRSSQSPTMRSLETRFNAAVAPTL